MRFGNLLMSARGAVHFSSMLIPPPPAANVMAHATPKLVWYNQIAFLFVLRKRGRVAQLAEQLTLNQ